MTPLPDDHQPEQPALPPAQASEPPAKTPEPPAQPSQRSQAGRETSQSGSSSPQSGRPCSESSGPPVGPSQAGSESGPSSPESSSSPSAPSQPLTVTSSRWLEDGQDLGDCLTAEQVAELAREDFDLAEAETQWYGEDAEFGPPELPASEWVRLQAEDDRRSEPAAEVFDAGFNRVRGERSGPGFAAGGPLDVMLPGSELAWHVGQARRDLAGLDDDQLTGVMIAGQKLEAWAGEVKLAAVSELAGRRVARDGEDHQRAAEEIGAALTQTPRSADLTAGVAGELERLVQTRALLANGIIDLPRVRVITRFTAPLDDADAAKADELIARRAGDLNTGRLTSACDSAVKSVDPAAAKRRKERALRRARVEAWAEPDGTAALAGRDLPPALVITADRHLDADAAWLRHHGAEGSWDELRAQAYLCRLNHQPLASLLPQPTTGTPAGSPPASPVPATPATTSSTSTGTGTGTSADIQPGPALGGTVNLTMPWSTFQRLTDAPGEVAGFGAADADTCRDLATGMQAAATRWCLTLTDTRGNATGHGCARAGPGPPATSDKASWLTSITIHKIETTACAHQRQSAAYQPPPSLRHLIKTRSRRCGYPGCGHPATRCDDDHTLAYHLGGRTCECNLYPLCRRHHQTKQSPGWHLTQPHPGHLTWTTPSGRHYTSTPDPYPV
jgi:Domain of unknown function (DUF222)